MAGLKQRIVRQFGASAIRKSALSIGRGEAVFKKALAGRKVALEIGTYRGISAACMAQYCERVVTIDLKHGRLEDHDDPWDRKKFWASLGLENINLHLVGDDGEKAKLVRSLDFDFAFIDGDHGDGVLTDFELVKRCGCVLFHDYATTKPDHSVFKLVNSLPKRQVKILGIFALWTAC